MAWELGCWAGREALTQTLTGWIRRLAVPAGGTESSRTGGHTGTLGRAAAQGTQSSFLAAGGQEQGGVTMSRAGGQSAQGGAEGERSVHPVRPHPDALLQNFLHSQDSTQG